MQIFIISLRILIFCSLLFTVYQINIYFIKYRLLRNSIDTFYENIKDIAEARATSEDYLQRLYGNSGSISVLNKLDDILRYSGLCYKFSWLSTELFLVLLSILSFGAFIVIMLVTSNILWGFTVVLSLILTVMIVLVLKCKLNYKNVESELVILLNSIESYAMASADLITIFENAVVGLDGLLHTYISKAIKTARADGNTKDALRELQDNIEHPFFKTMIQNLEISSQNSANYGAVVSECRGMLSEYLKTSKQLQDIYIHAVLTNIAILGLGCFCIHICADFILGTTVIQLIRDLSKSLFGKALMVYWIFTFGLAGYFTFFKRGGT